MKCNERVYDTDCDFETQLYIDGDLATSDPTALDPTDHIDTTTATETTLDDVAVPVRRDEDGEIIETEEQRVTIEHDYEIIAGGCQSIDGTCDASNELRPADAVYIGVGVDDEGHVGGIIPWCEHCARAVFGDAVDGDVGVITGNRGEIETESDDETDSWTEEHELDVIAGLSAGVKVLLLIAGMFIYYTIDTGDQYGIGWAALFLVWAWGRHTDNQRSSE